MSNKYLLILIIVLVLGGGYWLYNKPTAESPTQNQIQTSPAPQKTNPNQPAFADNVQTIVVTAKNFSFEPANINVKKGAKVKIILKNVEGFHDLKIDEYNVATKQINAGVESEFQFVADKTGTFEYYCSVGKHRAMGMIGKLVVE